MDVEPHRVVVSRQVRGIAKLQSHLEQNLTILRYRSMQIRALLVMINRLTCKSLCLKARDF